MNSEQQDRILHETEQLEAQGVKRRETFDGRHLDSLLIDNQSEALIVTFHGALDRNLWSIPRYERLRTTNKFGHSMLFFSDPGLWADETLELSWYAGWEGFDLFPVLAERSLEAAQEVGAPRIIFTGSSGGGFAALQVSALVPGSTCVPFNPQTSIHGYLAGGKSYAAQQKFVSVFYPHVTEDNLLTDWTRPYGAKMSPLITYAAGPRNRVLYADNVNDFHHDQHLAPLKAVIHEPTEFRVHTYEGCTGHAPPSPEQFSAVMKDALEWPELEDDWLASRIHRMAYADCSPQQQAGVDMEVAHPGALIPSRVELG